MAKTDTINVQGTEIVLLSHQKEDYISLTDMAKYKNVEIPATVISHWLSTNFSINYMGLWERMNNPDFNLTGFREVKETGFAHSARTATTRTACTAEHCRHYANALIG
jgi:phage antirepressor YoqD-like protein